MKSKFVLITGLMGSGKSTLLKEYTLSFKTIDFTKPDVEAKDQGLDFEFLDDVFAVPLNDVLYNVYELDAPTIRKWIQFINVAHSIIIVHNNNPTNVYNTPDYLMKPILENRDPNTPVLFVVSNYDDYEKAKIELVEKYQLGQVGFSYHIIGMPKGEKIDDNIFGPRIILNKEILKEIFDYAFFNAREE